MDRKGYDWNIEVHKTHWWFLARNFIIHQVITSYFKGKKNLKILDMGCGSGHNLKMLSEFGEVFALEPDKQIAKYAQSENPNCKIIIGAMPDDNPLCDEKFDLIVSLDVLEHIEDDKKTLIELEKMLNDDGKIIITVPALQFLYGPTDVLAHHYRRYNKTMLKTLIKSLQSNKIKLYYFNSFLFLPIVIVRLFEKYFRKNETNFIDGNISILNKFLFNTMSFERFLLNFNPIGVSLLAIIEKESHVKNCR